MTPFSRTGRRRNALITSPAYVVGAIIFGIGFLILVLRLFLPDVLTTLASPLWQLGDGIEKGFHAASGVFGNGPELQAERDRLVAENDALNEENRTLRAKLADFGHLAGDKTLTGIVAGVYARPPVAPYDVLVIDAGKAKGVKEGAYAYGPGGTPLGTVTNVANTSANIELYSTGGRTTEGWIGEKRIPVTLTGRGAGAFTASLPRDSGIVVNDVVYVPGPGAIPVGTVVKIDTNPSSPHDTLYIAPYVNLFSITWVTVAP